MGKAASKLVIFAGSIPVYLPSWQLSLGLFKTLQNAAISQIKVRQSLLTKTHLRLNSARILFGEICHGMND